MVKRNKGNRKFNLIDDAVEKGMIGKKEVANYQKHSKHHTLSHLLLMINAQSSGKSFSEAHKVALGKVKRKKKVVKK
tara:strand:- start:2962 stop:3192 length:231 start_codon:yes stop_codon:yes gene_type:complete